MAHGAILGQTVDAFTKTQTYSSGTQALYPSGTDTPDDVLALLSKAALYKTVGQAAGLYDVSNNLLLTLPGVQIATGSYVGTGKYGQSNPNSLTFEFEPKVVIISTEGDYTTAIGWPYIWGSAEMHTQRGSFMQSCHVSVSGNTMNYYNDSDEYTQLNTAKQKYPYIAIGF